MSKYLLIIACVGAILNAFTFPKEVRFIKGAYLARLLFLPFVGLTAITFFSIQLIHGVEYLFISHRMVSNSDSSEARKSGIHRKLWYASLIWGIIAIPRYFVLDKYFNDSFLAITIALLTAVDLLHFWLDRSLFRMRDPLNQRYVAPLIGKKTKMKSSGKFD